MKRTLKPLAHCVLYLLNTLSPPSSLEPTTMADENQTHVKESEIREQKRKQSFPTSYIKNLPSNQTALFQDLIWNITYITLIFKYKY